MHAEFIDVRKKLIKNIIDQHGKTIIAVGTTSLRTIVSLYWLGAITLLKKNISPEALQVHQWDAYEVNAENISVKDALQSLLQWMEQYNLSRLITKTQIIIAPGYKLKIAGALITNFHQPQSTLLLLVAALIGDDWRKVYDYALENNFRFLSYGDGCLLYPPGI
jgi:S-adenosylmethionine:tRNA ribosyltransferase-isomerase